VEVGHLTVRKLPPEPLPSRQIRIRPRPAGDPRLQAEQAEITHGDFEFIAADRPLLDRIDLLIAPRSIQGRLL